MQPLLFFSPSTPSGFRFMTNIWFTRSCYLPLRNEVSCEVTCYQMNTASSLAFLYTLSCGSRGLMQRKGSETSHILQQNRFFSE